MSKKRKALSLSLSLLAITSFSAYATPSTEQHIVVAPQCLVKKVTAPYKILASTSDLHLALLEVNNDGIDQLTHAKHAPKSCGGFMDVTRSWRAAHTKKAGKLDANTFLKRYTQPTASLATSPVKYSIKYQTQANQLIKQINPQRMWNSLSTLSSFPDRYSRSSNGVKAAHWFKEQVETIAKQTGHDDVSVSFVKTGSYLQPSVVAKVGNGNGPGIVIGGHMDTLSSTFSNKPGADDDGSGSVTVLEAARTLLSSGMHFKKPIYFIWYAAEEQGLVGSSYVVNDFKTKHIAVDAVLHLDMTGYAYKKDPSIWLIEDYVNSDLTNYLGKLIKTYVKQPVLYTRCGYACSDHASWTQGGFRSAIPFEASFRTANPDVHTSRDTIENLSLAHMTDYAKIAVAFAVELAEPAA